MRYIFSILLCLALSPAVPALSTDSEQPLTIKAEQASIDDAKGTTIYRGKVELQQGSMRIYADSLTLTYKRDESGARLLETVIAEGKPARFKQRPDKRDTDTEAEALRMEYYAKEDILQFKGNAQVKMGRDTFKGPEIIYDVKGGVLTATKVITVFHPQKTK